MSIENSRSSSIDGQWIRNNETKEFKYGYSKSEDAKTSYQKILERLALIKIRNELMFKGMLDAQLRSFARDGITITREQLIQDINKEVISQLAKQQLGFDLDSDLELNIQQSENSRADANLEEAFESVTSQTQAQIDSLKGNLSDIFGTDSVQDEMVISPSENISRESTKEVSVAPNPESTIQQANNPTTDFASSLENLSDDVKKRIIQQMESRGEVIISSVDNIYQEGNYIVVDAKDNQGRFTGAEFTLEDFQKLVNQPPTNIKSSEFVQTNNDSSINQQAPQEQKNKDSIINGILGRMADAGEFSYIPLEDVSQRVDAMNMVKKRLQEKSIDELEIILNSYANQDDKVESTGMHR